MERHPKNFIYADRRHLRTRKSPRRPHVAVGEDDFLLADGGELDGRGKELAENMNYSPRR
jgi:hypothetical protein